MCKWHSGARHALQSHYHLAQSVSESCCCLFTARLNHGAFKKTDPVQKEENNILTFYRLGAVYKYGATASGSHIINGSASILHYADITVIWSLAMKAVPLCARLSAGTCAVCRWVQRTTWSPQMSHRLISQLAPTWARAFASVRVRACDPRRIDYVTRSACVRARRKVAWRHICHPASPSTGDSHLMPSSAQSPATQEYLGKEQLLVLQMAGLPENKKNWFSYKSYFFPVSEMQRRSVSNSFEL